MEAIARVTLHPYALKLARPWATARGEVRHRRGILVVIETREGLEGLGEAAPLSGFSPEGLPQARRALERASEVLPGRPLPESLEAITALLGELALDEAPSAKCALEVALLDALAQRRGEPVARVLSAGAVERVEVNASLPLADPEASAQMAREAVASGFRTLKVKVGRGSIAADLERLRRIREAAGEAVALRVDANGAWSVAEARGFLREAAPLGLALVEQPVATVGELAEVRAGCGDVLVAADESARTAAEVRAVVEAGAADAVVLKPAIVGGLIPALEMASVARSRGLGVIVTTVVEGAVGRAGALHLAAALGRAGLASGLATGGLLATDLSSRPLEPCGGAMTVPDVPGLGVVPDRLWRERAEASAGLWSGRAPLPLVHRASYTPERPAVVVDGQTLSYRALLERACVCARRLAERGIGEGDRLGVWASNGLELVVTLHAAWLLGATLVALHPRWTAAEAKAAASLARARCVLVDEETEASASAAGLEAVRLSEVAAPGEPGAWRGRGSVLLGEAAAVLFSSGTTGAPKAIVLTYGNLLASATGSAVQLGHAPEDRWLCVLPLCHVAGLSIVMRCALLGTTAVVRRGFDAAEGASAIEGGACSLVSLVPTMLRRVLDEGSLGAVSPRFRAVLLGGGFISPDVLASARGRGLPVAPTYGMTEASSQVATAPPGASSGSDAGFPLVWTEVSIRDEATGAEVASSEGGELWVRGPTVSPGYLSPDGVLEAREGAWFGTGDFARQDEGGRLHILDRRTDRIVSGGENVHPSEVEAVLKEHGAVSEACVVGLPDRDWGHRVVAAVTTASGATVDRDELLAHARRRLASYKAPKAVVVVEELPRRGALGKVDRREVRRLLEASLP